jgi:hypothetical protein
MPEPVEASLTMGVKYGLRAEEVASEQAYLDAHPSPDENTAIYDTSADGGKGAVKIWDGEKFVLVHTRADMQT